MPGIFRRRQLLIFAFATCLLCPAAAQQGEVTSDLLIAGEVVDAETGLPIQHFRALPGTPYSGSDSDIAVWQPHLIREFSNGRLAWPRKRAYKKLRLRIEAEGYATAMSDWTGREKPQTNPVIRLRRAKMIQGVVLGPDGRPAAGATLSISLPNSTVRLDGFRFQRNDQTPEKLSAWWRNPRMWRCDDQGRFELPLDPDPSAVLCVVHREGYFDQPLDDFAKRAEQPDGEVAVVLERWARIDGQVLWLDRPGVGETVTLTIHKDRAYPGMITAYPTVVADEEGHYKFEFVPPGFVSIHHRVKLPKGVVLSPLGVRFDYPSFRKRLLPGEQVKLDIGGPGMVVTGKLSGLVSYQGVTLSIAPPAPETFSWSKMGMSGGATDLIKGYQALSKSPYGPLYFREQIPVAPDGTFRIENVMTGEYQLRVVGAIAAHKFTVSSLDGNSVDLGTIAAAPSIAPAPATPAPTTLVPAAPQSQR
ncbi:MAG: hypothetical protein MI861_04585 [Pirellulales bacterium]|nr:hypothetical protein [Pirellulales bacterium]